MPVIPCCSKQLLLSALRAWERLPRRVISRIWSVCMCVTDREGRVRASLLYPSYLLHLSYDFHLELNKLQSRLFKLDLGCLQQVGKWAVRSRTQPASSGRPGQSYGDFAELAAHARVHSVADTDTPGSLRVCVCVCVCWGRGNLGASTPPTASAIESLSLGVEGDTRG